MDLPSLTTPTAHLLSLLFSASYVGSLYISKNARTSFPPHPPRAEVDSKGDLWREAERMQQQRRVAERERYWRERDDPGVIGARLKAVCGASVVCVGVVWGVVYSSDRNAITSLKSTLHLLGLVPFPNLTAHSLLAHLPVPILFLGSLWTSYKDQVLPGQKWWTFRDSVWGKFVSWVGVRNYVVAPLTEELVFRSCVLAVYHLSGAGRVKMVFLSPLVFGLAHVHHAWDTYNREGRDREALKRAVFGSVFQLAYTTLFGSIASYLFLRTGSLYPALSAHVFCNILGVPSVGRGNKFVTLAIYLLGIAGFVYTLPRWTETPGSLFWT